MKISDTRNRRIKITFYTMAVVAVALSAYFFLYVQGRESYLHARNLRVLHRIQQNIHAKNETLALNVQNSANDLKSLKQRVGDLAVVLYRRKLDFQIEKLDFRMEKLNGEMDSLAQDIARVRLLNVFSKAVLGKSGTKRDSLALTKKKDELEDRKEKVTKDLEDLLAKRDSLKKLRPGAVQKVGIDSEKRIFSIDWEANSVLDSLPKQITFREFQDAYQREVKIDYNLSVCDDTTCPDSLEKTATLTQGKNNEGWKITYLDFFSDDDSQGASGSLRYKVLLSRSIDRFMQSLLRPRIFDETLLVKQAKGKSGYQVVFQTSDFPIQTVSLQDTLDEAFRKEGLSAQVWTMVSIGNQEYYAYFEKFDLNRDEVALGGLVEKNRFNGERYQVSAWVILMLSLFLLTLVLALPVLKLRLMSRYEQLRPTDVILSMAAAIFGTALLVLLGLDLFVYNLPGLRERKKHLVELSESVSQYFLDELEACYDQLEVYDASKPKEDQLDILTRSQVQDREVLSPYYPRSYPFFSSVFWVDAASEAISREITVKKAPTAKVSIAGRKYLEDLKKGKAWTLPSGRKFMLESLLTRTTGEHQAVISKTSVHPDQRIIFMLTNLYSVIRPALPPGFGYAVIDNEGLVWFHSNPTHNLQENFLEECDVKTLKAAMFARSSLYEDGIYQGEQFHFYLSPIGELPLYLVTFRDKDFVRSNHEQIISFTFLLMSTTFLLGISLVLLLLLFAPKASKLKGERFLFSWLQPHAQDHRKYKTLAFINFGSLIILTLFALQENTLSVAIMFGFSYVFTFLIAYMALETKQARRLRKSAALQHALEHLGSDSLRKRYLEFYAFLASRWGMFILLIIACVIVLDLGAWSVLGEDLQTILLFQLTNIAWGLLGAGLYYRKQIQKRISSALGGKQSAASSKGSADKDHRSGSRLSDRPSWQSVKAFSSFSFQILNDYRIGYRLFLLSWLLILSVVPVVKYYSVAFNRETKLAIKLSQLNLAKSMEAHAEMVRGQYRDREVAPGPDFMKDLVYRGTYSWHYFSTVVSFDTLLQAEFRLPDQLPGPAFQQLEEALIVQNGTGPGDTVRFGKNHRLDMPLTRGRVTRIVQDSVPQEVDSIKWRLKIEVFLPATDSAARWVPPGMIRAHRERWRSDLGLFDGDRDTTLYPFSVNLTVFPDSVTGFVKEKRPNGFIDSLLARIRPRYSDIVSLTGQLRTTNKNDSLWYWGRAKRETPSESIFPKLYLKYSKKLTFSSELPTFGTIMLGQDSWVWILMVFLLLVWMYGLLDFNLRRMFSENILDFPLPTEAEAEQLILSIADHAEKGNKKNLFLVIPPRAMGSRYFKSLNLLGDKLKEQDRKLLRFTFKTNSIWEIPISGKEDLQALTGKESTSSEKEGETKQRVWQSRERDVVVFNHFEDGLNEPEVLKNRLEVINLALTYWKHVILISTVDLAEFKALYSTWIREAQDKAEQQELSEAASEWSQSLSYFVRVLYPMTVHPFKEKDKSREQQSETDILIDEECCHGSYLFELREDLKKYYKGKEVKEEDVVLDIQSRARPYYQELWERTTPEERYVLYDLAEDGLVNTRNLDAIRRLLLKGLIVNTGDQLKVMNRSFRHHIITAISPEDAFQIESKIQAESLWRLIQTPLTIILVALGAFLFLTQREFISDTVKIIGAAVAFLPGLIQLFNQISGLNLLRGVNLPFLKKGS